MKKQNQKEQNRNRSTNYAVVCIDRENYDLFDLRSNKPIFFYNDPLEDDEEDFDYSGSGVFQEIDEINIQYISKNKRGIVQYFAPNSVGILLSTAQKAIIQAQNLLEEKICSDIDHETRYDSHDKLSVIQNKSRLLYDYIEFIQTGIAFGYTALETFVNLSIPDNYEFTQKNSKGIVETYDKEAIERWQQLRIKLSEILVSIYETKPLKGTQLWNKYTTFEELRNDIIHQKSINHTNFYKKYFTKNIFDLCSIPEEIIKFFFNERKLKDHTNPLWPWIIDTKNDFPSRVFKSECMEVLGDVYEGKFKK